MLKKKPSWTDKKNKLILSHSLLVNLQKEQFYKKENKRTKKIVK